MTDISAPTPSLLPCPHCGESEHLYPAHRWPGGGKPYAIDCIGCGTDFTPREGTDVIAAWNRRAPSEARLQSALEAREWQPIETAPKGTKIDLFDATAGIRAPDCYFHKKAQKWMCKWYGREGYSALRLPFSPTHWCATPPAAAIRKLQEQS